MIKGDGALLTVKKTSAPPTVPFSLSITLVYSEVKVGILTSYLPLVIVYIPVKRIINL